MLAFVLPDTIVEHTVVRDLCAANDSPPAVLLERLVVVLLAVRTIRIVVMKIVENVAVIRIRVFPVGPSLSSLEGYWG